MNDIYLLYIGQSILPYLGEPSLINRQPTVGSKSISRMNQTLYDEH